MIAEQKNKQLERLAADLSAIRAQRPLVHNITNYVVMEFTANALLALGASPVMAHAIEEAADMTTLSQALVINIGTLSAPWVEAMFAAQQAALRASKPVVLDPVGCGATAYRTDTARRLLQAARPRVVRGNASEIAALRGAAAAQTKGVDSSLAVDAAAEAAQALASQAGSVVVSGAVDLVVDASPAVWHISNGDAMMARVTGMGCAASALIGAFCAVNPDAAEAAAHAMIVMGVAGERAAARAKSPGSFKVAFLDALYELNAQQLTASAHFSRS